MENNISPIVDQILRYSHQEAGRLQNRMVLPEHILLGIIREGTSPAYEAMVRLGASPEAVKTKTEQFLGRYSVPDLKADGDLRLSQDAKRVMKICSLEARKVHSESIEPVHLLLSLLRDEDGMAYDILTGFNITYDDVFGMLSPVRSEEKRDKDSHSPSSGDEEDHMDHPKFTSSESDFEEEEPEDDSMFSRDFQGGSQGKSTATRRKEEKKKSDTPVLDNYSTDLTQRAMDGKMDPVVGRENEIQRVAQILNRKKKNNPVLIGEPGVGKSAIVEGLSQRIVSGQVPSLLAGKRLLSLDLTAVVSGTKYRGQFEERMRSIIKELQTHDDIILFIDELHIIMGAGSAQGSMDAANILKPALARGEIQCIGATTLDEYKKTIEKDGALERRFQKVLVEPTTPEETLEILRQIRPAYEAHHHVSYSDGALETCVRLTQRYVTDRQFPDKAIDALDEAGSRKRLSCQVESPQVKEQETLLEQVRAKKMQAAESQNFELAAGFRDREGQIMQKIETLRKQELQLLDQDRPKVDEEDIASTVSLITGIPVQRLAQSEGVRLSHLAESLKQVIIAQDEAIDRLSRAIIRGRVGLKAPGKPVGTFLFLGPTGVGKTYLTKQLALQMFGSEDALIRLDMSEYAEEYNVTKLIGTSPGYVGYEEGGHLTERVRGKPYSILLLDEIEKAHPRIFNVLLQLLDEGRLTDGFGRTVDFRNTVIIMTSNVGSRQLKEFSSGVGFQAPTKNDRSYADSVIRKALNRQFSPEFLNRIDEIITFSSLDKEAIGRIAALEARSLEKRIQELGYGLEITQEALEVIAKEGFDDQYGARPLKRALQTLVEDQFSDMLLKDGLQEGAAFRTLVSDGKIVLERV